MNTYLPRNLMLLPGVRTDENGRAYQYGQYPSGKRVAFRVPQHDAVLEPARTIPVIEPKIVPRKLKEFLTRNSRGEEIPVVFKPRRRHVLECRKNSKTAEMERHEFDTAQLLELNLKSMKPQMDLNEDGTVRVQHEPSLYDWHNCYHIDEEPK